MNFVKTNAYVGLLARLIIGIFFIVVATGKIADPLHFSNEINNYDLLPDKIINIMAIALPWLELVSGLLLIFGVKIKANSMLLIAMLFVFTVAVSIAILQGLDINCGCYSAIEERKVGWSKVAENIGLMVLGVIAFFNEARRFAFEKNL
jgi:putative oxidoreductase